MDEPQLHNHVNLLNIEFEIAFEKLFEKIHV